MNGRSFHFCCQTSLVGCRELMVRWVLQWHSLAFPNRPRRERKPRRVTNRQAPTITTSFVGERLVFGFGFFKLLYGDSAMINSTCSRMHQHALVNAEGGLILPSLKVEQVSDRQLADKSCDRNAICAQWNIPRPIAETVEAHQPKGGA